MVSIKVPVGLGGWVNEGWGQINGKTYTFPIGVETKVPEAVAHQINEIMKDEEDRKPVNPNPPGSSVTVDESLTISGAAADAAKTGEKIASLTDKRGQQKSGVGYPGSR